MLYPTPRVVICNALYACFPSSRRWRHVAVQDFSPNPIYTLFYNCQPNFPALLFIHITLQNLLDRRFVQYFCINEIFPIGSNIQANEWIGIQFQKSIHKHFIRTNIIWCDKNEVCPTKDIKLNTSILSSLVYNNTLQSFIKRV